MEARGSRKNLYPQAVAWWARISELMVGLTAISLLNLGFDYLLYPLVIYRLGILQGGIVMMLLSCSACLLFLWFYDWSKRDWLGIEAIKGLKGYAGAQSLGRLTGWLLSKSDPVVFLFLSLKYDPFITMAYLRHGAFNGMNRRDWRIFLGSLVVANGYWTLACFMGISLVEWAWGWLVGQGQAARPVTENGFTTGSGAFDSFCR